jgi:hypothetical protein
VLIGRVRPRLHLAAAALIAGAVGCTGLRQASAQADESRTVRPPEGWTAAVTFTMADSAQIEFFDGVRTRVVTPRDLMPDSDSIFGRTPWYRVHTRDRLATTFRVRVEYTGAGTTSAEYPLTIERGAFYGLWIGRLNYSPRHRIVGAAEPRSYPLPAAVQTSPTDSLWIYWGARDRRCWDCPS